MADYFADNWYQLKQTRNQSTLNILRIQDTLNILRIFSLKVFHDCFLVSRFIIFEYDTKNINENSKNIYLTSQNLKMLPRSFP